MNRPSSESQRLSDWFGRSWVRDAQGRPLVVYHGTCNGDVVFRERTWAFFSSNPAVASTFTKGRIYTERRLAAPAVYPVFLKIENPLVVNGAGQYCGQIVATVEGFEAVYSTEDLAQIARRLGHDGLIIQNMIDPGPGSRTYPRSKAKREQLTGDTLAVFDAKQIKSAVGNCGEFDPTNPCIAS